MSSVPPNTAPEPQAESPDSSTQRPVSSRCSHCNTELPQLKTLQQQIAALESQIDQLTEQVHTDNLTGLFNYRHFVTALEQEMERTQRNGEPTALMLIDLDHFKQVNDDWGHEVGNQALVQVARLLQSAVRKLDIACRYGGEEFVVILPATDILTGTRVAERLRALIAETPLLAGERSLTLTASIGIDVYDPSTSSTNAQEGSDSFVERTDAQLYRAKREGRNRVCHGTRPQAQSATTVSAEEKEALFGAFKTPDPD